MEKEFVSLRNLFRFSALTALILLVSLNGIGGGNDPDNDLRQQLLDADYQIVNEYGISLQHGFSTGVFFEFKANYTYRVVAYSNDQEVMDMDLLLTDSSGNIIKKDAHYKRDGLLNFDITEDVEYKLVIRNFRSVNVNKQHLCHMIVARKAIH